MPDTPIPPASPASSAGAPDPAHNGSVPAPVSTTASGRLVPPAGMSNPAVSISFIANHLQAMGHEAQAAIDAFTGAIETRRLANLASVEYAELRLNELEDLIANEILRLMTLHHPQGKPLRIALAITMISADLERIGDKALEIMQRLQRLHALDRIPLPPEFLAMCKQCTGMSRRTMPLLSLCHTPGAVAVSGTATVPPGTATVAPASSPAASAVNRQALDECRALVQAEIDMNRLNPAALDYWADPARQVDCDAGDLIQLSLITRHVERISDMLKNIAQNLGFVISGEAVHHGG